MCYLDVSDIRLWVRLGCTEHEQAHPQMVSVDVVLRFKREPKACESDQLRDTLCYKHVVDVVKKTLESRIFHLIEHMCHAAHEALCCHVEVSVAANIHAVNISVRKLSPPVPDIHGGVCFTLERLWDKS